MLCARSEPTCGATARSFHPSARSPSSHWAMGRTPVLVRTPRLRRHGAHPLGLRTRDLTPRLLSRHRQDHAITMANELGIRKIAIPVCRNAASAAAAYARSRWKSKRQLFMPRDVPHPTQRMQDDGAATVTLVDGLISDCARIVSERKDKEGWFEMSTLKDRSPVEVKKPWDTRFCQFDCDLPDASSIPPAGASKIGMWNASTSWNISADLVKRPQMIAVQHDGCSHRPCLRPGRLATDSANLYGPRTALPNPLAMF